MEKIKELISKPVVILLLLGVIAVAVIMFIGRGKEDTGAELDPKPSNTGQVDVTAGLPADLVAAATTARKDGAGKVDEQLLIKLDTALSNARKLDSETNVAALREAVDEVVTATAAYVQTALVKDELPLKAGETGYLDLLANDTLMDGYKFDGITFGNSDVAQVTVGPDEVLVVVAGSAGKADGTYRVTGGLDGELTERFTITVTDAPTPTKTPEPTLAPSLAPKLVEDKVSVEVGKTATLNLVTNDTDLPANYDLTVTFTNSALAKVDLGADKKTVTVTGVGIGTASGSYTITAPNNGGTWTSAFSVEVKNATAPPVTPPVTQTKPTTPPAPVPAPPPAPAPPAPPVWVVNSKLECTQPADVPPMSVWLTAPGATITLGGKNSADKAEVTGPGPHTATVTYEKPVEAQWGWSGVGVCTATSEAPKTK